jgi:1-acyl-sn-glycerol-3-phosphate acyltransferase
MPPRLGEGEGPLIIYSNHPGWWDGAIYVLAADRLLTAYEHYAPIDAAMLDKYRFFARVGGYGVDLSRRRGASDFLRQSRLILARRDRALWVAAQGRFADVRERPLGLKPGIARLCELAPRAILVPLAVEYAFWTERGAEACLAFGSPLPAQELSRHDRHERLARLEAALVDTLDRLAADVIARDPGRFRTVLAGRAGVGGIYDGWKRIVARMRGDVWDPAHAKEGR